MVVLKIGWVFIVGRAFGCGFDLGWVLRSRLPAANKITGDARGQTRNFSKPRRTALTARKQTGGREREAGADRALQGCRSDGALNAPVGRALRFGVPLHYALLGQYQPALFHSGLGVELEFQPVEHLAAHGDFDDEFRRGGMRGEEIGTRAANDRNIGLRLGIFERQRLFLAKDETIRQADREILAQQFDDGGVQGDLGICSIRAPRISSIFGASIPSSNMR